MSNTELVEWERKKDRIRKKVLRRMCDPRHPDAHRRLLRDAMKAGAFSVAADNFDIPQAELRAFLLEEGIPTDIDTT